MFTFSRLTRAFNSAKTLPFDNTSRIIMISDCHRGDNSWADDFANNQNLFFSALQYYYERDFTYIELGDGDELWKNKKFSDIRDSHSNIFWIMQKFFNENRLHMIWGNHDIVKKNYRYVQKNIYNYYDEREKIYKPLFEGIKFYESIILRHRETGRKLFLIHGHQGDLINDQLWKLGRFLVRYLWCRLELLGVKDPTSAAKNYRKKDSLEKKIAHWASVKNQTIITGHTHRPMFPYADEDLYFNDGSCVHPRCITGIEIDDGNISLIKWSIKTKHGGVLYVGKDTIAGPSRLDDYFRRRKSNKNIYPTKY